MTTLLHDLKVALRMLWKAPGFSAIAIAMLGLGIGATTAVFSVVNGVLLRPLPYANAERLVTFKGNVSRMDVDDIRERSRTLEDAAAVNVMAMDYTGGQEPVQVQAGLVNAGFFSVLGPRFELGRGLTREEDEFGAPRLVVVSHGFWQQYLGSDPGVIGRVIPLNGQSYAVVGVLGEGFVPPSLPADVFVSLRVVYAEAAKYRGVHFMRSTWLLKPGVTLADAQADMNAVDRELEQLFPAENRGRHTVIFPLQDWVVGKSRTALLVLFGAVGFVLLVACANFASLLLARAAARRQEIVIRAALGASRARLMLQMVAESLVVAMLGCAAGLVFAVWGVKSIVSLKPANLPRISDVSLDWRVLLFAVGVSLLTGLIFGLLPAWASLREAPTATLKETGRSATAGAGTHRLRSLLVVTELALAVLLLSGAGLLIKGFWRLQSVDPGFSAEQVTTMTVQLPESRYAETARQTVFRRQVLERLNQLQGVSAAMISELPLSGDLVYHNFVIEGRAPAPVGGEPELGSRSVMGDYFRTMKIPVLRGRDFTAQDRENAPLVGIVNEAMVRQFFPGGDAIGARIRWARLEGPPQWITIVGVASDVKQFGLDRDEEPAVYTPYPQSAQAWKRWMTFVVRTRLDTATLVQQVKSAVWAVDPEIPVSKIRTMSSVMAESMAARRFNMLLLALFAGLGLALAVVGVYGLMSYSVTQRTHEIGIRMALGADRGDVLKLVVREGMWLTLAGTVAGLAASFGLTRLMESMLFEVRPTDVPTFAAVCALLAMVSLAAMALPAFRAASVDPMVALRYE